MNTEVNLRSRALAYLTRREYTRVELEAKLLALTEEPDKVKELLDDFEKRSWLSDMRALEQLIHARQRKFGKARIIHEAREKGISDVLIEEALPRLVASELDAAREIWRRKFGKVATNAAERAKQMRFLQSRGFSGDICTKVLRHREDECE